MPIPEVTITTHQEILALANRKDLRLRVKLKSLGALHTAPTSYEHLRHVVHSGDEWICDNLPSLEGLAGLVFDLICLRDTLIPATQNAAATLHGPGVNVMSSFLTMKHIASRMMNARRDMKMKGKTMIDRARNLGRLLSNHVDQVLEGQAINIALGRIPLHLQLVEQLLQTGMTF